MFEDLFQMSGISLERLRSFLAVSEAGGMTKAANGDASKQSQLSKQVKDLEGFFGVELVRRSGRGIQLTAKGKELAGAIRESFTALAQFQEDCHNNRQVYSIGAGDSLLQWTVLPSLKGLHKKLADVDFTLQNLRTRQVVEEVTELKTDFGLVRSNAVGPRHESAVLGAVEYKLFVPKKLMNIPQRSGWRLIMDKVPLATMDSDGEFRRTLITAAEKAKIDLRIALRCGSFPLASEALQTGEYAAILPGIAANCLDLSSYHVVSMPFLKSQAREVSLIWNRRMPAVRRQSDKVLKLLKAGFKF